MPAPFQVDGLTELNRALTRLKRRDLSKRVGQAHREVGVFIKGLVDAEADPRAVGKGAGAKVRPSASRREVQLRVGGAHRADGVPFKQWGKRPGREPGERAPSRPFIRRIAERNMTAILRRYREEIAKALDQF